MRNRTIEVGDAECGQVRARLGGDAVEAKIRPQGRPDEAHTSDRDRVAVEQRHAMDAALSGEDPSSLVDVATVELVVPGHVQEVPGRAPFVHRVAEQPWAFGRGEIAGDDDKISLGGERRDGVSELEVEVGDDLDAHQLCFVQRLSGSCGLYSLRATGPLG